MSANGDRQKDDSASALEEAETLINETARFVRALPYWDETLALGEDLIELAPARRFLASHRERLEAAGRERAAVDHEIDLLSRHLDYCVNFELHRRKLFFADASPSWMLHCVGCGSFVDIEQTRRDCDLTLGDALGAIELEQSHRCAPDRG